MLWYVLQSFCVYQVLCWFKGCWSFWCDVSLDNWLVDWLVLPFFSVKLEMSVSVVKCTHFMQWTTVHTSLCSSQEKNAMRFCIHTEIIYLFCVCCFKSSVSYVVLFCEILHLHAFVQVWLSCVLTMLVCLSDNHGFFDQKWTNNNIILVSGFQHGLTWAWVMCLICSTFEKGMLCVYWAFCARKMI